MKYFAVRNCFLYRILVTLIAGFFVTFSASAIAENIENLYESKVLVQTADNAEPMISESPKQNLLIEKAFINVLYKVTGSREFLAIADSKKLLANAQNLVQKFGYENIPIKPAAAVTVDSKAQTAGVQGTAGAENTDSETQDAQGKKARGSEEIGIGEKEKSAASQNEEAFSVQYSSEINSVSGDSIENVITTPETKQAEVATQKVFWVHFNKQATNQLLNEYGLPVWDSLRPDTLIWLSIEENRQRQILTPALSPEPFNRLKQQATIRGIPLLVPFGDLEDKNRLTIADLWGNFSDAILAASQRYHTQAVLAIRVFQEPSGLWIGNWSLYILGENANWQVRNENLNELLTRGIDRLANNLASRFAIQITDDKENSLTIQINNVVDFKGFLKVKNYLKKAPAIKKSTLIATYRDSLLYDIEYLSNEKHLLQSLNLGNVLQKVEASAKENNTEQLEYTPVILDDSAEQTNEALASLEKPQSNSPNNNPPGSVPKNSANQEKTGGAAMQVNDGVKNDARPEEKNIPLPAPDVEYWLVN